MEEVGVGPKLYVYPYDETFIVVQRRARFFVGDEVLEAEAEEVVLGPAGLPHGFVNQGPRRVQTIDIRHSSEWIQKDLEQD